MPLGLRFQRFTAVPILRVICTTLDRIGFLGAVIAAHPHSEGTRISAAVAARLAFRLAATRFAQTDRWKRHLQISLHYISRAARWTGTRFFAR
jgi:hypothetical protein